MQLDAADRAKAAGIVWGDATMIPPGLHGILHHVLSEHKATKKKKKPASLVLPVLSWWWSFNRPDYSTIPITYLILSSLSLKREREEKKKTIHVFANRNMHFLSLSARSRERLEYPSLRHGSNLQHAMKIRHIAYISLIRLSIEMTRKDT